MKNGVALPNIADRETWFEQRRALLEKEKEATRMLDAVRAEHCRLPMVKVEKEYAFEGPDEPVRLLDLFEGRRQLLVHHFMWFEEPDRFCPSCSLEADQTYNAPFFTDLHRRGVTFVAIARAPTARIEQEKAKKGWDFPFYSSRGSDFNYDFQATIEREQNATLNYQDADEIIWLTGYEGDLTAKSVFLRDGTAVYHANSAYARGLDLQAIHYRYLDLSVLGRQEDWEEPAGRSDGPLMHWLHRHDRYVG